MQIQKQIQMRVLSTVFYSAAYVACVLNSCLVLN